MFVIPEEVSEMAYLAQGYVKKQIAMMRQNPELMEQYRKKLVHFAIRHDDLCGIFRGSLCNCDADIEVLGEQPENVFRN